MKRSRMSLVGATLLAVVAAGTISAQGGTAADPSAASAIHRSEVPKACVVPGGRTRQIATAKLIIEYNATDGDLGVHGAFDDDGWESLCVLDPDGNPILVTSPQSQMRDLAVAGIFFESREPPLSEFGFRELARTFPEGEYRVVGKSFDGSTLVGSATFTHDVPAPPTITSPAIAEEPREAKKDPVSVHGLTIGWERVLRTIAGDPVDITGYEVIVTKEVDDDPNGFSRPTYDVHVPPDVRRLHVPEEFLEGGAVYELEVLALEVSGNQTISVGFFATES